MFNEGLSDAGLKRVAEPNFHHATEATTQSKAIGSQVPIAPRLLSHLPTSRPTMFSTSARAIPNIENATKNAGLACAACHFDPADVQRIAGREIQDRGKIWEVAGPINPPGKEAGKVAEGALAPDVHAAFLRVARGKLHDAQRQRNENRSQAEKPDNNGAWPSAGRNRDPAQAERGDHVEHHQVAETQHPLGLRRKINLNCWRRLSCGAVWHRLKAGPSIRTEVLARDDRRK